MPPLLASIPHVDETYLRVPRNGRALGALVVAAFILAVASSATHAQDVAEKNGVLTDAAGKTLYTFDKDGTGKSNCTGTCTVAWPPFIAQEPPKVDGAFTQIMREDGRLQWARDGKPLYFFSGDGAAGDVKGDGVGGVWHAVKTGTPRAAATSTYDTSYYYKY
jgi:predicted lipoprotein with Yx(FWY)xxD motif